MLEATRSSATNLSLTSSTSLDDSCDSFPADYEEGCPHPLQCSSPNNRAQVKQQQRPHSSSSSLLMQQATSKIKQRQRVGATNAIARSKILASYNINAVDHNDGNNQHQRSSNPNNKQQARIPSTVFKYMFKCEGSGRTAVAAAKGNNAAGDANNVNAAAVDAAAVSAGVNAYDATVARDDADKSKGEPAVEPGPDDAVDEAPKQKTAAVKPQQVGCTKNVVVAQDDANISKGEPVAEPRPNDAIDGAPRQTAAVVKPQQVSGAKKSIENHHSRPPKPSANKDETAKRSEFQHQLDRAVHEKGGGIPVAIRYFTRKAREERARRDAESRRRAIENMSEAHRHFRRLTIEMDKQHNGVEVTMREVGSTKTKRAWGSTAKPPRPPRPAAMEHFARKGAATGGG